MGVNQHELPGSETSEQQPEALSELGQLVARMAEEYERERMRYLQNRHPNLTDASRQELEEAEHELVAQVLARCQEQFGSMEELPWNA